MGASCSRLSHRATLASIRSSTGCLQGSSSGPRRRLTRRATRHTGRERGGKKQHHCSCPDDPLHILLLLHTCRSSGVSLGCNMCFRYTAVRGSPNNNVDSPAHGYGPRSRYLTTSLNMYIRHLVPYCYYYCSVAWATMVVAAPTFESAAAVPEAALSSILLCLSAPPGPRTTQAVLTPAALRATRCV